jgi:succinate dehydrogenase / fumarate reductase membrane anchor subunit
VKMRVTSSSHRGLSEWLVQRVTAIYLGVFLIFLIVRFVFWPISDFDAWRSWFTLSWVRIVWLFAFGSLLLHAWIGLRSVFLDYIKSFQLRLVLTLMLASGLLAIAIWVVDVLFGRGG